MLADNHGEEETAAMSEGRIRHELQSEADICTLIEKGNGDHMGSAGQGKRLELLIESFFLSKTNASSAQRFRSFSKRRFTVFVCNRQSLPCILSNQFADRKCEKSPSNR